MSTRKPFYLHPPWNILFEIHKLEKVKPWSINISFLLTSFLEEMRKQGEVDFRASGVALDSSAFIYMMKSKLLLKLEEPPNPPKLPPDFIPPPIFLPLRYELTSTTIEQLLEALDSVLKGETLLPLKPRLEPILPPPTDILPEIDRYLMEIETLMESLYGDMLQLSKGKSFLTFTTLVFGKNRIETIRTFILLLFLAQRQRVWLWQEVEFGEIYISVSGDAVVEGNRADFA
jgi:chromatin segregation and condensation protein Rec8/ScpA/Scc1 (kleisin family)